LYAQSGLVPEDEYLVPLGSADIKRIGTDVKVPATGRTILMALSAAAKLSSETLKIKVIDPPALKPLDSPTIMQPVKETHHLVVVSDGWPRVDMLGG
jgi:pyruvate/2-oxoglutarate/acetoin dehydrogenase E1 component